MTCSDTDVLESQSLAQQRLTASLHVDTVTRLISKLTDTLFPNGELAPVVPDPTVEEVGAMREELELCVYNRIPGMSSLTIRVNFSS